MWDDAAGMYTNVLYNGSFYPRYAPTSFFPLISGQATEAQAVAAMATASAPTGFCLNTSYTPDPSAAMLLQWWDGHHDNAACATDECNVNVTNKFYNYIRVEAVVLLPAVRASLVCVVIDSAASLTSPPVSFSSLFPASRQAQPQGSSPCLRGSPPPATILP
jgi:hypothetical protein